MIAETILAASILLNPQAEVEEVTPLPVTPMETFVQMQQDIELLEERIEFLTNRTGDLTNTKKLLTDEKSALEMEVKDLKAENQELRREVDALKAARSSDENGGSPTVSSSDDSETTSQSTAHSDWETGVATAYGNFKDAMNGETGITADGWSLDDGLTYKGYKILAADPSIPFGTVVEIKLSDGTTFKGVVKDRGGAIKGNKFDVVLPTKEECFSFGRQTIQFRLTGEMVK